MPIRELRVSRSQGGKVVINAIAIKGIKDFPSNQITKIQEIHLMYQILNFLPLKGLLVIDGQEFLPLGSRILFSPSPLDENHIFCTKFVIAF